jgi:hypothetical protein
MKSTGENRQLGEKPLPVPLCSPQISHGLDMGSNPGLRGERPATNRLSHGTASRLRRLGYLCRMQDQDDLSIKLTIHKPEGTRRVGRPAVGWLDSVEEDMKIMAVGYWRRKSQGRD